MSAPGIVIGLIGAAAGIGIGYAARHVAGGLRAARSESVAEDKLKEATLEADSLKKESKIRAKEEVLKAKEEFEKSTQSRRKELDALEERLSQREINLDRKVSMIDKKESAIDEKIRDLETRGETLAERTREAEALAEKERRELQRVAGMSQDEARQTLFSRIEKEVHGEMGSLVRRLQEEAKETAERYAAKIVSLAIQRYAGSHASESMTSSVDLPNDEMKGRIIGREGRNIRALEAATGVSVLIDDTPEAVVISAFDPVRREIARQAIEQLIADGRIHPARIEEIVEKTETTLNETIRTAGEEAAFDVSAQGCSPELLQMLGRLKFRTSYSQNVLQHSLEVAHLMGTMAGELGLDTTLAKRIGLFHDIGKALDHEVEGGHAVIGADLLKRHSESPILVNAVAAHHEEVEAESPYAVLAAAADAISSSRPGARSETTAIYAKRLEKLEGIANGFEGVAKSYAIQAGREVRVLAMPDKIDDNAAMVLARDISKKIESDLQYPGQVRVTVIRETRCVEYAR